MKNRKIALDIIEGKSLEEAHDMNKIIASLNRGFSIADESTYTTKMGVPVVYRTYLNPAGFTLEVKTYDSRRTDAGQVRTTTDYQTGKTVSKTASAIQKRHKWRLTLPNGQAIKGNDGRTWFENLPSNYALRGMMDRQSPPVAPAASAQALAEPPDEFPQPDTSL